MKTLLLTLFAFSVFAQESEYKVIEKKIWRDYQVLKIIHFQNGERVRFELSDVDVHWVKESTVTSSILGHRDGYSVESLKKYLGTLQDSIETVGFPRDTSGLSYKELVLARSDIKNFHKEAILVQVVLPVDREIELTPTTSSALVGTQMERMMTFRRFKSYLREIILDL